jgi:hypothetical protein
MHGMMQRVDRNGSTALNFSSQETVVKYLAVSIIEHSRE